MRLRRAARAAVPVTVDVVQGAVEVFMDGLQEAAGCVVDQSWITEQRQAALRQGRLGRQRGRRQLLKRPLKQFLKHVFSFHGLES